MNTLEPCINSRATDDGAESILSTPGFDAVGFRVSSESKLQFYQAKLPPQPTNQVLCHTQLNYSNSAGTGDINFIPTLVSAALVIAGWYVVNRAQSNRERRKQIREYISNLCDNLEELESMAVSYHTSPREEEKEQEIISKLGRFEKACSILPSFINNQRLFKAVNPEKLNVNGACLQGFRKAMTLKHFGEEHDGPLTRRDEFMMTFDLATEDVQADFDRLRIEALD